MNSVSIPFRFMVVTSIVLGIVQGCTSAKNTMAASTPPALKQAWLLDISKGSEDELLAATVMQGLANRSAPKVFLFTGDRNWVATFKRNRIHHSAETLAKYRNADDAYLDYYTKTHNFTFHTLTNLDDLATQVAPLIKGVVLYDEKHPFEWIIAAALAGPLDLIPVTEAMRKAHPTLSSLPVKENVSGRFKTVLEGQRWAYQKVGPLCSTNAIYSVAGKHERISMDIAVARHMFVYHLNSLKSKAPEEAAMIDELLSHLEPCSPVFGWGLPNEGVLRDRVSENGHFVMCCEVPNISFHAQVKPLKSGPLHRRYPAPTRVKLDTNTYYVAFMVNEGDTLKAMATLMSFGMWLEPQRGQVPINWGTCPWITENFPALMEYYYDTMAPGDSFFAATTGYGYFSPNLTPNLGEFARREIKSTPFTDLRVGASWGAPAMTKAARYAWFDQRKQLGTIMEDGKHAYLDFTPEHRPVISTTWNLFYPFSRVKTNKTEEAEIMMAVDTIEQVTRDHKPPFFIPVYGGNPSYFDAIAKRLPPGKFKFVTLEEMMLAARQAGPTEIKKLQVPPVSTQSVARVIHAAYGKITVDGESDDWKSLKCGVIEHDLRKTPKREGNLKARYRFAWNEEALVVLVEELPGAKQAIEFQTAADYRAASPWQADSVAFWMDFVRQGAAQAAFIPWFGFCSKGQTEAPFITRLNGEDNFRTDLKIEAVAKGILGQRIIEARISWEDLNKLMEIRTMPSNGLVQAIRPGFTFGCQPLLVEGGTGQGFLDYETNKLPNGFDANSIDIELKK
jgi:hypothetical protein